MRMVALPSRGMVAEGVMVKAQKASSTITCATVTGSGPPLLTLNSKPVSVTSTRWRVRSSMGGSSAVNMAKGLPNANTANSAASSTSGMSALTQVGRPPVGAVGVAGAPSRREVSSFFSVVAMAAS